MKKIVILCAGDFGKEVAWLIEDINRERPTYELLGFLDDDPEKAGKILNGYTCLGPVSMLPELAKNGDVCAVTATQNSAFRKKFTEMFPEFREWETLIHPSAHIAENSSLGRGCIVCVNSVISVNSALGDHCILNIGTTIGHDCAAADYVSFMSGTVISGHVSIAEGAYFGSNSTVIPGRKIGAYAKVGAGSVVIRNVKDGVSVMGVPAMVLRV